MYQFYYADERKEDWRHDWTDNVHDHFEVTAIRPAMWEEHCLECAAPLCYQNCLHYVARSDGRCKRFVNGFLPFFEDRACCGQGVQIGFRKWANMMTVIFPAMLSCDKYSKLIEKNQKIGNFLKNITNSALPVKARWEIIRTVEYLRRRMLKGMKSAEEPPDAFIFHGFSYHAEPFNLIVEVYDEHTPVYKMSLRILPGENLVIRNYQQLSQACWKANYLIKIYPENNLEVMLDILWCDFVQGRPVEGEHPAKKVKCVVWDLDNTLWNGTLVETDVPEQLCLNAYVLDTIHELDRRGIIQSVASKNDMKEAWAIVEKLGLAEYFLYPQIGWNAKSSSLEEISKCLNIGIDTLALVDDSKFEREQVRSVWPQVRSYDVSELPSLLDRPEMAVIVTEESKKRRAMYRAEEKRSQLKENGNEDTITFLKKCHLQMTLFTPKTKTEILRCYELVMRTNQLNMSGEKYSQEEFEKKLCKKNHTNFAFSCKDDFGEYGIVGFGQYRVEHKCLEFTEFAMSCRVAGKYVESALFEMLLQKEHCAKGMFYIKKTKKNTLLRKTLEGIGFRKAEENDAIISYVFKAPLQHSDLVLCNGWMNEELK